MASRPPLAPPGCWSQRKAPQLGIIASVVLPLWAASSDLRSVLGTARLRPNAALVGLPRMVYQFPCKCAQFSCGRGSSSSRTNMLLRAVLISWLALRLHLQCTARLHIQSLIRLSRHENSFNVGPLKLVARQRRIWCRAVYSSSQWPSHYQLNNPPSFYPSSPPGNGIELIPNKHRPHPAASTLPLLIVGQNGSH